MNSVKARLDISVHVNCPNCGSLIDLLNEGDTGGLCLNDDNFILDQALPDGIWSVEHKKFEVEEVICSICRHEFMVNELDW